MFEKHIDEYHEFENIPIAERLFESLEMCALHYIYGLLKDKKTFGYHAKHDELYLADIDQMRPLTEADVLFLTRCGIGYDETEECLYDFC